MTKIHTIELGATNCFVICGKKNILVNCGKRNEARKLINQIEMLDISDIALIIITHAHSNYCGALSIIANHYGCPVSVDQKNYEYLINGINVPDKQLNILDRIIERFYDNDYQETDYEPYQADIIIDKEIKLNEFGLPADVVLASDHSKGLLSIICQEGWAS